MKMSPAGIDTDTEPEMQGWLRTHAALVVPMMLIMDRVYKRGSGLSWTEAREFASAMAERFALVRSLGHSLTPSSVEVLSKLPSSVITLALWLASRSSTLISQGDKGVGEARTLIDAMVAAAPTRTPRLQALRP